jgi:hypothetical protein
MSEAAPSSNALYLRDLRAKAREQGLCSTCRAREARTGLQTCQSCVDRGKAHRKRVKGKLCRECCAKLPRSRLGKARCKRCAALQVAKRAAQSAIQNLRGECARPSCRRSLHPGSTMCLPHLEHLRERAEMARRAAGQKARPCHICGGSGHYIRSCGRSVVREVEK